MATVNAANKHGQGNGLTRDAAAKALANRGAEGDKLLVYLGTKTDDELAAFGNVQEGDDPDDIFEYLRELYDDDRGEIMQALNKLFPTSHFKNGTLPDVSLRSTTAPLSTTELSQAGLGGCMEWVGREIYKKAVNNSLEKLHNQWQKARDGKMFGNPKKKGVVRIAITGPRGMGKSSMAECMMMDAADQVGPTELQNMLKRLVAHNLQYRMDFSQHPRLKDEQGGLIRPAQALALRMLYTFCHETGQSYAQFIQALKGHEDLQSAAVLLSSLRSRHVVRAARAALLPEGCEPVAFHMIMENFHAGFELGKEDQDKPGSTVTWATHLLRAQAWDWLFEDDLLLVSCVCTNILGGVGRRQTHQLMMQPLQPAESAQICTALQQRLLGKQVELPPLVKALLKWSLGNPGHLACLMSAAAQCAQQQGEPLEPAELNGQMLEAGVKQILGQPDLQLNLQSVLNTALIDVTKETPWDSWLKFEQGQLIKILIAYHGLERDVMPDQPVDPRYTLHEGGPAVMKGNTPLTFEMLEWFSLAVLLPSKRDTDERIVWLPPLVLRAYNDMAIQNQWLSPGEQYLLEGIYKGLQPGVTSDALSYISMTAWATQLLDGPKPCKVKHLLEGSMPEGSTALQSLADLEVMLPDGLVLEPLDAPDWKAPDVVRREIEAARAGQRFAYKGRTKRSWWLFLKTTVAHPSLVIIRAHGLPAQYSQASIERVTKKHRQRLEIDDDIESGFIFVTGVRGTADDVEDSCSSDGDGDDDDNDDRKEEEDDDDDDEMMMMMKLLIRAQNMQIRMMEIGTKQASGSH